MTGTEIRESYIHYFEERNHKRISSAKVVPENDPTTLFTSSGMQPLVPYLLGENHPSGIRLVNSQKCFRAGDIDEVGDNRHTTFFEMLGNWSLGDYFKQEQLPWFFEFLTEKVGLDPKKLYVTAFAGDDALHIPQDTESAEIWRRLFSSKGIEAKVVLLGSEENGGVNGMQGGRIFYYDIKNWWSRSGAPSQMPAGEPGGPSSEVFYEFTDVPHDERFGAHCHPNCDCGRFMEIGNSVFMEYLKLPDGSFGKLPKRNVDFGGGLERIAAAAINSPDVFSIDLLLKLVRHIETVTGTSYQDKALQKSYRVIADHVRASIFMIADGVLPSNTDQGYILRRLLRRAIRHYDSLGNTGKDPLSGLVSMISALYKKQYPEVSDAASITRVFDEEEVRFRKTLREGMREFERRAGAGITGETAFVLFSTYGFPFEMTEELAKERGLRIDHNAFRDALEKHQELSRKGAEQKFKGGLADHSAMSVKYHTATHLLHQALRSVLGDSVFQKGSNITPERLRFDFSFDRKMTDDEKARVEIMVNEQISRALPVTFEDIPLAEAEKRGALGLFEEKYGDVVRVYKVGDFSLEFCGGPHVENTSELGVFTIQKEEAVAAGVRRIKAILT